MDKDKNTHGGARAGAGRKPLDPKSKASTRSITLPADAWAKVDTLRMMRGNVSPSELMLGLIKKIKGRKF